MNTEAKCKKNYVVNLARTTPSSCFSWSSF